MSFQLLSYFIPVHPLHPRRNLLKVCRQVWKGEGAMAIQDPLTELIIGCCSRVANELGPGFLEKIYENALAVEWKRGFGLEGR